MSQISAGATSGMVEVGTTISVAMIWWRVPFEARVYQLEIIPLLEPNRGRSARS
jgi:hypothetical protein